MLCVTRRTCYIRHILDSQMHLLDALIGHILAVSLDTPDADATDTF